MRVPVAVQRLNPRHRPDIARHLARLPLEDRYLRFGRPIDEAAIAGYVETIDFARDRVFAIHSRALELTGVAHLALDPAEGSAELGLSVDRDARDRGQGFALLERAVLHAANAGYRLLFMVCLAENRVMLHLAVKAGLRTVVSAGEAEARLPLDRRVHGGALKESMAEQIALVDLILKQQTLWLTASVGTG